MRTARAARGSVLSSLLPRLVVAGGIIGGILLQAPLGQSNADRRRNDFRYTPDVDVMRVLSFGHRSTMTDAVWLRALPDFSRPFDDKELKERWLNGVFAVCADLDPTFYTAYSYGSTYLSLINRQADSAIALLERGVATFERIEAEDGQQYPGGTRLRIDLAMAYWMFKKDREKTLHHLDIAVARPDCDFLTRGMRVGLALKDRADLLALTSWAMNMESGNAAVREKAELEFETTKRSIARRCHREFVEREGRPPESVEELAANSDIEVEAAAIVWPDVVYDDEGMIQVPKLAEYELRALLRSLEWAADTYRRDYGDWPDDAWFFDTENNVLQTVRPGELPEGQTVTLDDDGTVRLIPAADAE